MVPACCSCMVLVWAASPSRLMAYIFYLYISQWFNHLPHLTSQLELLELCVSKVFCLGQDTCIHEMYWLPESLWGSCHSFCALQHQFSVQCVMLEALEMCYFTLLPNLWVKLTRICPLRKVTEIEWEIWWALHCCSEWCCSSLLWCVAVSLHKVACCLHGACMLQLHGASLGCISQ